MKPKISIVSLTVSDLNRALAFYRDGLGFPTHNYADGDDYVMFRLEGSWLSLHAREVSAQGLFRWGDGALHGGALPQCAV